MPHRPSKTVIVTTIEGEDPHDALDRLKREHRTGRFSVDLSQGGTSHVEWQETLRGPDAAPRPHLVVRPA